MNNSFRKMVVEQAEAWWLGFEPIDNTLTTIVHVRAEKWFSVSCQRDSNPRRPNKTPIKVERGEPGRLFFNRFFVRCLDWTATDNLINCDPLPWPPLKNDPMFQPIKASVQIFTRRWLIATIVLYSWCFSLLGNWFIPVLKAFSTSINLFIPSQLES